MSRRLPTLVHLFRIAVVVWVVASVFPVWHLVSDMMESEDRTVVWAVVLLYHLVMRKTVWVVELGVGLVAALLCRALLDRLKSHSGGSRLLWVEQVRGSRDIFWRCSARRTDY